MGTADQQTAWQQQATFIGGHRKSGTTLLLNLFDSHPQLCVFPPDSGFFYAYYPPYASNNYSDDEKKQRVIDVMYYNFRLDLEKLEAWQNRTFPFADLNQRFLERMQGKPCTPGTLLQEAIFAYQDVAELSNQNNPLRWLEKTTSTEIYAAEVFAWFPEARFIHVLRDPRDNFGSLKSGWKARYQHQQDSVERLLQSMIERGLLGMKLAKINQERFGAERYRVVRYEDLTNEPEATMRDLSAFLGIDYDDSLLIPTYYGLPWRGNNFDGLKFDRPSTVNVGRWCERIDNHEAQVIEFYFANEMQEWGYEPVFSGAEQANAARDHYKWANFAQKYSVLDGANTYQPSVKPADSV